MKKKKKASLDPVVYTLLFVIRVFVCMCVWWPAKSSRG